jgi:hypothetical protein
MRHDLFRFSGHHVPQAAILIQRTDEGTHTGIIYRGDNDELQLLEFYLGGEIISRPWMGRHPHVIPNTGDDSDALENLASLCRVIAKRYQANPRQHLYGFRRSRMAFVNPVTGQLYLGDSVGATCASFVLIVLSTAGIPFVVDGPDWPYRPGVDDPAHAHILAELEQHYPDPAYLARVRAELPCPRVAPAEVAGAGMCPHPPASQPFAERAAQWIMELFAHNDRFGV